MDRETFYRNLISAMVRLKFKLQADDLSAAELASDKAKVDLLVAGITQISSAVLGGALSPTIELNVNHAELQQRLDKMSKWAAMVFFKYVAAQPVIIAVVEADSLAHQELVDLAKRLDDVVSGMLDMTGKVMGKVRLSVTGIILHVFMDHSLAARYIERSQRQCKITHYFKKTSILPWVIDVPEQVVTGHPGMPFLFGVISRGDLQKRIFR